MDYRHWDAMLAVLAAATIKQASDADVHAATQEAEHTSSLVALQQGWAAVFDSGAHELVDLRAEGKDIPALKQILMHSSKVGGGGVLTLLTARLVCRSNKACMAASL